MLQLRSACPIASALHIIGEKWSLIIIRSMVMGASNYSDFLSTSEKISTNILAERLRLLEGAGLILQATPHQGSIRGYYRLTTKGAALIPTLQELARWGATQIPNR